MGCGLHTNNVVWGCGNYKNKFVFIGEAPGKEEDKIGKPFVGRSGMLLTKCMKKANLNRPLFYITNVVKCRPDNNRKPSESEIQKCSYYLEYELRNIKPYLIITLGSTATSYFIKNKSMGNIVGRPHKIQIKMIPYIIYPLYHPSYVLRGGIKKQDYINLFLDLNVFIQRILKNILKRVEVLLQNVSS